MVVWVSLLFLTIKQVNNNSFHKPSYGHLKKVLHKQIQNKHIILLMRIFIISKNYPLM